MKSESSRLADLSNRTGWILWFCFVCVCNCYLLLGGGRVGCVVEDCPLNRFEVDWIGLDWIRSDRTAPSWPTNSLSILGSDLDLDLDGDLDGRGAGWLMGGTGLNWIRLDHVHNTRDDGHEPNHVELTLAASVTVI